MKFLQRFYGTLFWPFVIIIFFYCFCATPKVSDMSSVCCWVMLSYIFKCHLSLSLSLSLSHSIFSSCNESAPLFQSTPKVRDTEMKRGGLAKKRRKMTEGEGAATEKVK